jgi:hypothetical protein
VVADAKPVSACEYATEVVPLPNDVPPLAGARVPKLSLHVPGLVVSYRNHPVVAAAFGLPDPLRVAPEPVTNVAADVVTDGTAGVMNDCTVPTPVPITLEAIAQ